MDMESWIAVIASAAMLTAVVCVAVFCVVRHAVDRERHMRQDFDALYDQEREERLASHRKAAKTLNDIRRRESPSVAAVSKRRKIILE